jgi:hypothetical protein
MNTKNKKSTSQREAPKEQMKKMGEKVRKMGKKGGSALAAGVTGAAIGAAVGGVTGVALSDEKTRKKVGTLAGGAKKLATDAMQKTKVEMPSKIELPTQKGPSKTRN